VREILEETSLLVRPDRITGVYTDADIQYPNGDRVCYVVTIFACTPLQGQPTVNDDESLEIGYFALDSLPPLRAEHHRRIDDAVRGQTQAVFIPPGQITASTIP
jgi:8-oxo-dGTP pyrophosphatase MutT (NUDIX family)